MTSPYPPQPSPQPNHPPAAWPPAPPPPAKRKTGPVIAAVVIGAVALCCTGGAIAAMSGGDDDKPASSAASSAAGGQAVTTEAAEPAPTKAAPTKAAPPPAPAKPATLLTVKGTGTKKTAKFRTDDEWSIKYTFDCANFGQSGNFQIFEYVDGEANDVLANELAKKGADTIPVYSEGEHYLTINSTCKWSVTVLG